MFNNVIRRRDAGSETWTNWLDVDESSLAGLTRHGLGVLALSASYGAAMGWSASWTRCWTSAIGVPVGLIAVVVLGAPALAILLSHAGTEVHLLPYGAAFVRALSHAGLLLAGLAPALALVVLSSDSQVPGAVYGTAGLVAAAALAGQRLASQLSPQVTNAGLKAVFHRAAVGTFLLFAALLLGRMWFRWLAGEAT